MDDSEAVVTPGGVGFDINCGVRLLRSNLTIEDVRPLQEMLADEIYSRVPVGVGGRSKGKHLVTINLKNYLKPNLLCSIAFLLRIKLFS